MVFQQVRNYLQELRNTVRLENKLFSKHGQTVYDPESQQNDLDLRRLQAGFRSPLDSELTLEYKNNYENTHFGLMESDHMKDEPFEFYTAIDPATIPESRLPSPGIDILPIRLHQDQVVTATEKVPESGLPLDPPLATLLRTKYSRYLPYTEKYCRPLGTTDATFEDFNREQIKYPDIEPDLIIRICSVVTYLLNARRFLPLHYVDTFFAKMPLATGTSYFYRHSYEMKTHAIYSHPREYESKNTSKGFYINAFTEWARTVVHRIKEFGIPFSPENLSPQDIRSRLRDFFISHATMLFTRNHISDRDGNLKQRPVYAMDTLFLHLECMITFPLHIMARSMKSSIMYSIETVRGGCAYMDSMASQYKSYLCLDWSSFDQRMPWIIVDTFFTFFLPHLIIISHGYAPTAEYPTYPDLTPSKMFSRMFNILCFIRLWYYNCVFCTADGWAYARRFAGIASGMLNTQYLDSYCNLFLIVHALFHFGCTEEEIFQLCIYVMGDDNVLLTHWDQRRLNSFLTFFTQHSLTRFGMVLSQDKSILTVLRYRIEMLGYTVHNGRPRRPLGKLIAQLCYPEHGMKRQYMSSRAVGMAWAAAGMDPVFHRFCYDVYCLYLPWATEETEATRDATLKHLPGMFKMLDDAQEFTTHLRFPSVIEVHDRYSKWQGELDIHKKWNPAHFLRNPDYDPEHSFTMQTFMLDNNIKFPSVEQIV
jgi:hypothetical protein